MDRFLKLTIRLENEELTGPTGPIALSEILERISEEIKYGLTDTRHSVTIWDSCGNRVGQYKIVEE